jgi:hypothetical protein
MDRLSRNTITQRKLAFWVYDRGSVMALRKRVLGNLLFAW